MQTNQAGADKPAHKNRALLWVLAAVGVVIVAAAVIIPVSISAAERAAEEETAAQAQEAAAQAEKERLGTFVRVVQGCSISGEKARILDGGETLDMSRVAKFDGASFSELMCVLDALDAPSAIETAIGQTRALDGRQHDSWDGYEIAWAYHPDDGASVIIEHAG